jgi:hypothetical protein
MKVAYGQTFVSLHTAAQGLLFSQVKQFCCEHVLYVPDVCASFLIKCLISNCGDKCKWKILCLDHTKGNKENKTNLRNRACPLQVVLAGMGESWDEQLYVPGCAYPTVEL